MDLQSCNKATSKFPKTLPAGLPLNDPRNGWDPTVQATHIYLREINRTRLNICIAVHTLQHKGRVIVIKLR